MRQCPSNLSFHPTRMIEQLLEFYSRLLPFAHLEVCQPADVGGIQTIEGLGVSQVVFNRGPQDFYGRGRIVGRL
jgi:hypothetical protein